MTGVTDAVNDLAALLGVEVVWREYHANNTRAAVFRFTQLASQVQFSDYLIGELNGFTGDLLDQAAGQAGITDPDQLDLAESVGGWAASHAESRARALDRAAELLPKLRELGAVR